MTTFADMAYNTTPVYEKYENGIVNLFSSLTVVEFLVIFFAQVILFTIILKFIFNKLYPQSNIQKSTKPSKDEYSSSYTQTKEKQNIS